MTKARGEIPFPHAGEGVFLMFSVSDLMTLEEEYGEDFFEKVEIAVRNTMPKKIIRCVQLAMKRRDESDRAVRVNMNPDDWQFHIADVGIKVLDALSLAVTKETYGDLLEKIAEAKHKQVEATARELKEAADKAGTPFTEEALVAAIYASDTALV